MMNNWRGMPPKKGTLRCVERLAFHRMCFFEQERFALTMKELRTGTNTAHNEVVNTLQLLQQVPYFHHFSLPIFICEAPELASLFELEGLNVSAVFLAFSLNPF